MRQDRGLVTKIPDTSSLSGLIMWMHSLQEGLEYVQTTPAEDTCYL